MVWGRSFKNTHGGMPKFLESRPDLYIVKNDTVALKAIHDAPEEGGAAVHEGREGLSDDAIALILKTLGRPEEADVQLARAMVMSMLDDIPNLDNFLSTIDPTYKKKEDAAAARAANGSENKPVVEEGKAQPHWFDFNDGMVSVIDHTRLALQYGGKESAYMLFYARKGILEQYTSAIPQVPPFWQVEVSNLNESLELVKSLILFHRFFHA